MQVGPRRSCPFPTSPSASRSQRPREDLHLPASARDLLLPEPSRKPLTVNTTRQREQLASRHIRAHTRRVWARDVDA
jgi:hypothetical protein